MLLLRLLLFELVSMEALRKSSKPRKTKKSVVVVVWACVYGRANNRSCRLTPISPESEQESTTYSKSDHYKTLCFPETKKDHSKSDNYKTGHSGSDQYKMLDCAHLSLSHKRVWEIDVVVHHPLHNNVKFRFMIFFSEVATEAKIFLTNSHVLKLLKAINYYELCTTFLNLESRCFRCLDGQWWQWGKHDLETSPSRFFCPLL